VFDYEVGAVGFPPGAQYVALGHLHRRQQVPGFPALHYCGSPLALDFGEVADAKAVLLVDVQAGGEAQVTDVALVAGRPLRTIAGTLAELRGLAGSTGDAWLKVVVREGGRIGLADEVRHLFPNCVDVVVDRPVAPAEGPARPVRPSATPTELFAQFLAERGDGQPELVELFAELLEEAERSESGIEAAISPGPGLSAPAALRAVG
jgi:exonuclease SbcD